MQNALKDPASRFGPVVSSPSPPRYSKPPSTRPAHFQQFASEHVGAEPRYPSSTLPFMFKQGIKLSSPASTIAIPNVLGLSRGPPRTSKGFITNSALLNGAAPVGKRQFATTTTIPNLSPITKKTTKPSNSTPVPATEEVTADAPPLPAYDYASHTPKPTRSYIRTAAEANTALGNMIGPLGFDLEWRVVKRKGVLVPPVAVVQIADERRVLILQTSAMRGVFPKKLKEILEDPTIIKTGVNIKGDAQKLYKDHKVKAQNLVELSWLSRQADSKLLRCGGKSTARTLISLQKLTAAYLGKDLVKSPVRTGNWEALLGEEQLKYASNDAHCSVVLYHYLMALAKSEKHALRSDSYTLNVNLEGEVVAGTSETARSEEMDAFEAETLTLAIASSAPMPPAQSPVATASGSEAVVTGTARAKKAPPRTITSKVATTSAIRPPNRVSISKRPPEIIELSDSDSDLEFPCPGKATKVQRRRRPSLAKSRLTEAGLQRLSEAIRIQPSSNHYQVSALTSTPVPVRKPGTTDVELQQLEEDFKAVNLDEAIEEDEESAPLLRGSPRLEAAAKRNALGAAVPVPFGTTPFGDGPPRISRTMAYALGVRK